jgi:hypothetical protein
MNLTEAGTDLADIAIFHLEHDEFPEKLRKSSVRYAESPAVMQITTSRDREHCPTGYTVRE